MDDKPETEPTDDAVPETLNSTDPDIAIPLPMPGEVEEERG